VSNTTWLHTVAQGKLNVYGTVQPAYTLTLAPGKWPPQQGGFWNVDPFNIGDVLPLIIKSGRLDVNTTVRIMALTYDVGDDFSGEDITLTVARPHFTLLDSLHGYAKGIRQLSRR
jgi:hypothetical protein